MGDIFYRYVRPHKCASLKAFIGYKVRSSCRQFTSSSQVIFSGIQPTGIPHLGNYLGALDQWVRLQNAASETTQLFFAIADLHALTSNNPSKQLLLWKRQLLATLIAVGLDPERSTIFYQSSVLLKTMDSVCCVLTPI